MIDAFCGNRGQLSSQKSPRLITKPINRGYEETRTKFSFRKTESAKQLLHRLPFLVNGNGTPIGMVEFSAVDTESLINGRSKVFDGHRPLRWFRSLRIRLADNPASLDSST